MLSTSQKELSQSAFEASLGDVVCDRSPKLRDEAPAAYKDLSEVMENQVRGVLEHPSAASRLFL